MTHSYLEKKKKRNQQIQLYVTLWRKGNQQTSSGHHKAKPFCLSQRFASLTLFNFIDYSNNIVFISYQNVTNNNDEWLNIYT